MVRKRCRCWWPQMFCMLGQRSATPRAVLGSPQKAPVSDYSVAMITWASQPTPQSAGLLQMQRYGMAWVTFLQPYEAPGACLGLCHFQRGLRCMAQAE